MGPSLRSYKKRRVRISLRKRYSVVIVIIRVISPHLGDVPLKMTTPTPRTGKQLENGAVVGRNRENNATRKRTIL